MSNGTINKVILIGNLGRDPEIRTMQNGKEMASFSIATSESWTDKSSGIRSEKTEWHSIVVFNEGLVKVVKDFARKGSKVYIEGSLRTRKYTDQNGSERYITEVLLQNFSGILALLDSRNSAPSPDYKPSEYKQNETEQKNQYENFDSEIKEELIDDEIPF
ncbi:single-stranded DNA-binding protein [Wolbachia endosymbiont of Tettigetta isshikii]|uniref:single-stranded DNA-binding protein n=1 Tax=Wolbachia endosymbiont of Tettigetta isshikii TaxID=3239093 RepID=UPI0039810C98